MPAERRTEAVPALSLCLLRQGDDAPGDPAASRTHGAEWMSSEAKAILQLVLGERCAGFDKCCEGRGREWGVFGTNDCADGDGRVFRTLAGHDTIARDMQAHDDKTRTRQTTDERRHAQQKPRSSPLLPHPPSPHQAVFPGTAATVPSAASVPYASVPSASVSCFIYSVALHLCAHHLSSNFNLI